MIETPHPTLLNRVEPAAMAALHLHTQIALLKDVANYGSNLIIRTLRGNTNQMAQAIVCGTLLPKVVAMVDAVEVLLSAGCAHAALLQGRSALEASIYIEYILHGDTEKRATRYLVANYRRERLWNLRVIPGTAEYAAYKAVPDSMGLNLQADNPDMVEHAKKHLAEINRVLAQPVLSAIDKEFDAKRGMGKKRRQHDHDWYALDDRPTLRSIAKLVGRDVEYEAFYSRGSQAMHGSSYKDQMSFLNGAIRLKPLRNLTDATNLIQGTLNTALRTYSAVLTWTLPAEVPAMWRKYTEDWREAFLNIPTITVSFAPKSFLAE